MCSVCDYVSLDTEDSVDFIDNKPEHQVMSTDASQLVCVLCGTAAAASTRHLKVLPCLHVTCHDCLVQFLSDKSLPHSDAEFASSISVSYTHLKLPTKRIV